MSRVGNNPINLPEGVSVEVEGTQLNTRGPKGELQLLLPAGIELSQKEMTLQIIRKGDEPRLRALHGTVRALLNNNVIGVSKGWDMGLELVGVGYRAQLKGKELSLSLGYSHEVRYPLPDGVSAQVTGQTKIAISCIDKQKLGHVASEIKALHPPEPYKGKGIRYANEQIRRKAGKAGKAGKK